MNSDVSSEKPKELLVAQVAERMRLARAAGGKILAVCGPAVIHTGAGPDLARLVRAGWIDVLFAGNGFATHDIESNVLGTSLGVPLGRRPAAGGRPQQPPAGHQRGPAAGVDRRRGGRRATSPAG